MTIEEAARILASGEPLPAEPMLGDPGPMLQVVGEYRFDGRVTVPPGASIFD